MVETISNGEDNNAKITYFFQEGRIKDKVKKTLCKGNVYGYHYLEKIWKCSNC